MIKNLKKIIKKGKYHPQRLNKNTRRDFFGFLKIYIFIKLKRKLTINLLFKFPESVLCQCEMFYLTTFGPDIGGCIVHVVIFIKKY